MLKPRRPVRSIQFRSTPVIPLEPRFPRAVAGEEFDRYARAMSSQARRWLNTHWSGVVTSDLSMHDVRETFRVMMAGELGRRPRPQEERLLSALLHESWPEEVENLPDILPFWSSTDPTTPRPAA